LTGATDPTGTATANTHGEPVITLDHVKTYYPLPFKTIKGVFGAEKRRYVKAVEDVSLTISKGCALGVVGESGCGKSTLAKSIMGLEKTSRGRITFLGLDITRTVEQRNPKTISELQMIFQDPDGTLNPSYTVGAQIATSVRRFTDIPKDRVYEEVVRLLTSVKLSGTYYYRYPRQLSGGEKQRVGIARAIAGNPKLLVCDEPVSALDVSVQAAILTLMREIQSISNTTIVLISHDLSTVRFFSDYVAVMYLGCLAEIGPVEAIYHPPFHPYTAALLAAVPRPDPGLSQNWIRLSGNVPSPINPPSGCRFNTRCPNKIGRICETTKPPEVNLGNGHKIFCHLDLETLACIGQA
jgi:peptide/nickel transport system ATP-binding protein